MDAEIAPGLLEPVGMGAAESRGERAAFRSGDAAGEGGIVVVAVALVVGARARIGCDCVGMRGSGNGSLVP